MSSGLTDPSEISSPLQMDDNRAVAERWLAAIVESSDDAILSMSLHGVITTWNAAATRIFGYEPQEAIGHPVSLLAWPG